jgi:hypothetical protein
MMVSEHLVNHAGGLQPGSWFWEVHPMGVLIGDPMDSMDPMDVLIGD